MLPNLKYIQSQTLQATMVFHVSCIYKVFSIVPMIFLKYTISHSFYKLIVRYTKLHFYLKIYVFLFLSSSSNLEHCMLQIAQHFSSLRFYLSSTYNEEHPWTRVVHHLGHHGTRLLKPEPVLGCGFQTPDISW